MLVKKSHNEKKRVKKSTNAAKNKAERQRNNPRMSITTLIILCTVVPLLLGGFANYFAHKTWILYLPLTGLLLLLGYLGHLGIRSLANSRSAGALQFSVASEGGFTTMTRDVATRFCLALWHADEYIAVPITDLMLVRFTNSEVTPTMINYYSVEVRVPNGKWQNVLCLNGLNGKLFMRGKTVNEVSEITLDDPRFDLAVKDINIPPNGGAVKGWLFLERPEGFDASANREWRLRARDIRGREGYSIIPNPAKPDVDVSSQFFSGLGGFEFKTGDHLEDISKFRMTYYSDFLKH